MHEILPTERKNKYVSRIRLRRTVSTTRIGDSSYIITSTNKKRHGVVRDAQVGNIVTQKN